MTLAFPTRAPGDSWLARRDARWRLGAFLIVVLAASTVGTRRGGLVLVVAALIGLILGRVPVRAAGDRLGLLALGVVPLLVAGWLVSPGGAVAVLTSRVVAIGLFGLTLARVAPLADTFTAARSLGFPRVLCEVGRAADRQAGALAAEVRRTRVALRTRGFVVRTSRHSYRTLGYSLAGMLVRADARSQRVAAAMRTRGYAGSTPPAAAPRTGLGELALVGGAIVVATLAIWLDRVMT